MNKNETWMVIKYWNKVGGTLIEEFPIVKGNDMRGKRFLDGLVILDTKKQRLPRGTEISVKGKDIVILQAKNRRLGMPLMGQTLFSKRLIEKLKPKSAKSVALCTKDDVMLRQMLEKFKECEVVDYEI